MNGGIPNGDKQIHADSDYAILQQAEGGVPVAELCREHGLSRASIYKWRAEYGGIDAYLISQMNAMEDENRRVKRM